MIQIFHYHGERADMLLNRAEEQKRDVTAVVSAVLNDVKARGDTAVLEYCERFDGARPKSLLVTEAEIEAAYQSVEPELLRTMELAARNIERFHMQQKRSGFVDTPSAGVVLGQRVLPLASVGLYVPSGTARYPSSVLMNAIPAKIAGVEKIVMTTPPDRQGNVPAVILAAARLAGVHTIVKLGGAQAIAALAYGTATVPKVDKIV
ncbi:MAG: histidinol dehydrogenase, partial [Clostridia bacterium]